MEGDLDIYDCCTHMYVTSTCCETGLHSHAYSSESTGRTYLGSGGDVAINGFVNDHQCNAICHALDLPDITGTIIE